MRDSANIKIKIYNSVFMTQPGSRTLADSLRQHKLDGAECGNVVRLPVQCRTYVGICTGPGPAAGRQLRDKY